MRDPVRGHFTVLRPPPLPPSPPSGRPRSSKSNARPRAPANFAGIKVSAAARAPADNLSPDTFPPVRRGLKSRRGREIAEKDRDTYRPLPLKVLAHKNIQAVNGKQ